MCTTEQGYLGRTDTLHNREEAEGMAIDVDR